VIDPLSFPSMGFDLDSILAGRVRRVDRYIPVNLPLPHVGGSDILSQKIGGGIGYKTEPFFLSYSLDCRGSTLVLQQPLDQEQSRVVECI
jgi:hypothetical protein